MLGIGLAWVGGTASKELRTFDAELAEALQQLLEEKCAESTFEGVSYSIAVPGYEIWTGTYGNLGRAVKTAITPNSVFGIASVTKTYVAAIILQLRDEGKLRLDDLVSKHLGRLTNVPEDVTIRHLLSMTSGLANFSSHPLGPIWDAVADRAKVWTPEEVLEKYLSPPSFNAGERYMYSNTNFLILGMVVEKVTDQKFNQVLKDRILKPYSLDSTFLGGFDELPEELALTDYNRNGQIEVEVDAAQASISSLFWTSGGMFATSSDMARWGKALFAGEVLSEQSLAQMVAFDEEGFGNYGLGTMPGSQLGYPFWGHGGLLSYASSLEYSPDTGITVSFAANMDRMFGTINYWPHDDMLALLREYGVEAQVALKPVPVQFVNTEAVELDLELPLGFPRERVAFEVVNGDASLFDGQVSVGGEGIVSIKAVITQGDFYRGESNTETFTVYSRFGDDDGDGIGNAVEALLGSDLSDYNSRPRDWFRFDAVTPGFRGLLERSDIPYRLEISEDLATWLDWKALESESIISSEGDRFFVPWIEDWAGKGFLRVRVL